MIWSWLICKNGARRCVLLALPALLLLGLGCQPKENDTSQELLAQFTYKPIVPVVEEIVVFDGSTSRDRSGGQLTSYEWDFGNGKSGRGAIAKQIYTTAGEFRVKLTVTNAKGAKGTAQQTVRVFGPVAIKRELAAPSIDPRGLAWDGQSLWVADGYSGVLYQLNPADGSVRNSFEAPTAEANALPSPEGLAWDGTNLWMVSADEVKILKLRPSDGKVLAKLRAPSEDATGLAWDGSALWVSDLRAGKLYRLAPGDGRILKTFEIVSNFPVGLAWDGQALWVSDEIETKLYRIDPVQGRATAAAKAPNDSVLAGLTWDGQALWLAASSGKEGESGKLYRVTAP